MDATETSVEATGQVGDVGMLQEVAGWGPVSGPTDEEDHLLAASEVVNDSGSRPPKAGGGSKRSDLGSRCGVSDGGRVVI